MKQLIYTGLVALTFLCPKISRAIDTDKAAHIGISYMLTVGAFGLYKAILTRDCRNGLEPADACPLTDSERLGAALFAAATSLAIGVIKESGDRQIDYDDLAANGFGTMLGVSNIILFQF